jgi:hypothetical protein
MEVDEKLQGIRMKMPEHLDFFGTLADWRKIWKRSRRQDWRFTLRCDKIARSTLKAIRRISF